MTDVGAAARRAAQDIRLSSLETRRAALDGVATSLLASADMIFAANQQDMSTAQSRGLSAAMLDR
ncbi:MAG: gamma-glutamyl-phosphate reductase, partial [Pseudomonadota bacterium]